MQLDEFYDYKNQMMKDLLTNESIVDMLSDGAISVDEADQLAYTQVFPFEYVPETEQEGRTFICFDVDVQKALNKTFFLPTLYVWVFAHKSKLRLPQGGVRTDAICAEIARKINGSFEYGMGELDLNAVKRFAPVTDYQGKVMVFYAKDFSKVFDPNKTIPANRKKDF